jgi:hypothetical protein
VESVSITLWFSKLFYPAEQRGPIEWVQCLISAYSNFEQKKKQTGIVIHVLVADLEREESKIFSEC